MNEKGESVHWEERPATKAILQAAMETYDHNR